MEEKSFNDKLAAPNEDKVSETLGRAYHKLVAIRQQNRLSLGEPREEWKFYGKKHTMPLWSRICHLSLNLKTDYATFITALPSIIYREHLSVQKFHKMMKPGLLMILIISLISCEKSGIEETPENQINTSFYHRILEDYFVTSMAFDDQGTAWIGTFKQGVIKNGPDGTIVYNSSNSIFSEEWVIRDIAIGSQGNVWFAAEGLVKYDGASFTLYNTENSSIPEDIVWDIEVDSRGHLWFSSCRFNCGGLVHYNGSEWTVFTPDNSSLPDNSIHGIAIDDFDNVWLAVADYVNDTYLARISSAGQWSLITGEDLGFQPYYYGNIRINSKNEVCAAIDYSLSSMYANDRTQVFIFNGQSTEQLKYDSIYNVRKITVDNRDNIWGITGFGYAVYDGKEWFTDHSSFRKTGIFAIEQAPDNRMWIGTGQGIYINE